MKNLVLILLLACAAAGGGYWAGKRHAVAASQSEANKQGQLDSKQPAKLPPVKSNLPKVAEASSERPTLEEIKTRIQELRGREFRRGRDMMRLLESVSPASTTIPLRRRIASTAERMSATVGFVIAAASSARSTSG